MSLPSEVNPHLLASSGGYQISRSLRFSSARSVYLSRTFGTPTNNTIFTWSAWIKRGTLGSTYNRLFTVSSPNDSSIRFDSADTLSVYFNSTTSASLTTTQVFRDPSAWYHIVVSVDTPQATSSNRIKIYVNGVQVTAFGTASYPTISYVPSLNSANDHAIGRIQNSASEYFDGYLTEINFIDGQALTPSSFGAYDTITGVWNPIAYSGTYGNNGFYLNFKDPTNTTTVSYDYSGNANHWTSNQVVVGSAYLTDYYYDSMTDTPTNYGTDTGAGNEVRGNYCTLNPLNKYSSVTLQEAGLRYTTSQTGLNILAMGTMGFSTGKWYWEMTATTVGTDNGSTGIMKTSFNGQNGGTYPGYETNSVGYHTDGGKSVNGTYSAYGSSYASGVTIGIAVDCTAGTIEFFRNGTSQGVINAGINYEWTPAQGGYNLSTPPVRDMNFGQRPFKYTTVGVNRPAVDYKALCSQNMTATNYAPVPNGARYVASSPYTGTGTTQGATLDVTNTVNGAYFTPDLLMIKDRVNSTAPGAELWYNHVIVNSVRGVGNELYANTTQVESTSNNQISSFNSNGFTVRRGASLTGIATNLNGGSYSALQWRAGGAGGVTNNDGNITSTVSANKDAGFSIATFTAASSASTTVGHGLGKIPAFKIVKSLYYADFFGPWRVWHQSLEDSFTPFLELNTNAAKYTLATNFWGTNNNTTSVFNVGSGFNNLYVAFVWSAIAGYSAFGSYVGNGSSTGPFVYTGFRSKVIWIKRTDTTGNWYVWDTSRNTYNVLGEALYLDLATPAGTGTDLDILSNGFKLRSNSGYNTNNGTYIYCAWAENPFKYSRAR